MIHKTRPPHVENMCCPNVSVSSHRGVGVNRLTSSWADGGTGKLLQMNSRETFRMRSDWLSLQCFGECRIITILQQKVLFSLLTFSIAKKRLRQWDEGCDPYPSDNLVMTWLVPVYVHLLFLLVRIPPWKLTCPPKRDHFFKDMDHLRTINFQGIFVYIRWFDGWWLMVHVEVFLEACPHCCYHGEKEASWIHIKTFQAKVPTFSELLHFLQESSPPESSSRVLYFILTRYLSWLRWPNGNQLPEGVGSVFHVGIQAEK